MARAPIRVGTAGWSIPRDSAPGFAAQGSGLERYAGRFAAVEINSSFHRPHRPDTYARWAQAVPGGFSFAAKMPREITHDRRLVEIAAPLDRFLSEVRALGENLGPLLVQLPPNLRFEPEVARAFFETMRQRHSGPVACEPRHAGWFTDEAEALLRRFAVARVAADPAKVPQAAEPGGFPGLVYYRLHGSPVVYRSDYGEAYLDELTAKLARHAHKGTPTWCIFDNTMLGAATANALGCLDRLKPKPRTARRSGRR